MRIRYTTKRRIYRVYFSRLTEVDWKRFGYSERKYLKTLDGMEVRIIDIPDSEGVFSEVTRLQGGLIFNVPKYLLEPVYEN